MGDVVKASRVPNYVKKEDPNYVKKDVVKASRDPNYVKKCQCQEATNYCNCTNKGEGSEVFEVDYTDSRDQNYVKKEDPNYVDKDVVKASRVPNYVKKEDPNYVKKDVVKASRDPNYVKKCQCQEATN